MISSRSQRLSEIFKSREKSLGQVSCSLVRFRRVRELQTAMAAMAAPLQLQDGDRVTGSAGEDPSHKRERIKRTQVYKSLDPVFYLLFTILLYIYI